MQQDQGAPPAGSGATGAAVSAVERLTSTPVDADGVAAVALGTAAWVVAGAVLALFFRPQLAADGNSWWLWVCAVGAGLGLIGLPYVVRRRSVYRRHAAAQRTEGAATE